MEIGDCVRLSSLILFNLQSLNLQSLNPLTRRLARLPPVLPLQLLCATLIGSQDIDAVMGGMRMNDAITYTIRRVEAEDHAAYLKLFSGARVIWGTLATTRAIALVA